MSRTLKRPMFRRGGTVNNGIMTGIVDREQKQIGDVAGRARELTPELESLLREFTPQTKLPIGQFGLNLASGKFAGDGLLSNIAGSLRDPLASFTKRDDAREAAIGGGAAKLGISQAMEEAKARAKAAGQGMQKDYSPQRAYEDAVSKRVESAGKLKSFEKPNIEQKYPRATAEYDIYVLRNLRSTTNETGRIIAANNAGFVPFDPKSQSFDYNAMQPGAFYYDPRIKAFVQRIPASDDEEGGFFIYDKNTFAKRKLET
jgi:hypothetical protein|tara:strand:+ start:161 stop:937 length:777 start_codon:yes stop_codon:yes gene_type:complete